MVVMIIVLAWFVSTRKVMFRFEDRQKQAPLTRS
nr:MAG TPA: hypothetical protein [Caudoviricetes sp.]